MSYGIGESDTLSLVKFLGAVLLVTVGLGFLVSQGAGRGGPQAGQSFKAVEPIAEGTKRPCSTCNSTGQVTCSGCGGKGRVILVGLRNRDDWCPGCGGSGKMPCGWCKGSGILTSAQPGVLKWEGGKKP
jgi:hypothetical protein